MGLRGGIGQACARGGTCAGHATSCGTQLSNTLHAHNCTPVQDEAHCAIGAMLHHQHHNLHHSHSRGVRMNQQWLTSVWLTSVRACRARACSAWAAGSVCVGARGQEARDGAAAAPAPARGPGQWASAAWQPAGPPFQLEWWGAPTPLPLRGLGPGRAAAPARWCGVRAWVCACAAQPVCAAAPAPRVLHVCACPVQHAQHARTHHVALRHQRRRALPRPLVRAHQVRPHRPPVSIHCGLLVRIICSRPCGWALLLLLGHIWGRNEPELQAAMCTSPRATSQGRTGAARRRLAVR